jgi:hypothetical protein
MKSTMSDRLVTFIKYTGLLDKEFANQIGSTKQEISNWKGGQRISLRRIGEMLEAFPVLNGHWLLTGLGNMLNTDNNSDSNKPRCENPECLLLIAELEEKISILKEKVMQLQSEKIQWLEEKSKS